jgi:solute:Na+ symporter, SSS family
MAQVVLPIYFIIKDNVQMVVWMGVLILTTALLKKYWWDRLPVAA